jgi:hypothetical protein
VRAGPVSAGIGAEIEIGQFQFSFVFILVTDTYLFRDIGRAFEFGGDCAVVESHSRNNGNTSPHPRTVSGSTQCHEIDLSRTATSHYLERY